VRGNNRRRLFSYTPDYKRLLWLIERAAIRFKIRVHGLVIMTNHVHLIVTPDSVEALASFVKSFAQRYAQYRNKRRAGSGKLFEERYKVEPLETEGHVAAALFYCDMNPVRAGMVRHPRDYRWSAHGVYAGADTDVPARLITPIAWYVALGDTAAERRERYLAGLLEYARTGDPPIPLEDEAAKIEERSMDDSRVRVERPDGTSAREPEEPWGNCAFVARSGAKTRG
jgi:putative transposase